ncbi:MAG: MoaD/ThiS family protein [Sphingomonadaceae bacterium]
MVQVDVMLSGRLKLDGYGRDCPSNGDGTFRLEMEEGCTVPDVIRRMGVPPDQVAMTMVNGRIRRNGVALEPGDRVVLVPPDVAALWRYVGLMNMGRESALDF